MKQNARTAKKKTRLVAWLLEDAMIAATARVHQLIIATRNEADFRQLDVRILNPFKTS